MYIYCATLYSTGKLEMVIPWKKLIKDHVIVTIDEVYIIVGPEFGE